VFSSITIGRNSAKNVIVDYEKEDGTIEKKNVAMMMKHVLEDMFRRCS
jgi:hypothetical protein